MQIETNSLTVKKTVGNQEFYGSHMTAAKDRAKKCPANET